MQLDQQHKYRFPWQTGNSFELLVDGPVFFNAMLDDIRQAKDYILVEMYLVNPGTVYQHFFTEFCQAVERGVSVYLLFDDFGSRGLSYHHRQALLSRGIHLAFYNPLKLKKNSLMLFRDHRKLLLVDGRVAYVGGTGITDEFDSAQHPERNWRENMVRIKGPNVLQWQALFSDNWARWSTLAITIKTPEFATMHQRGRVAITTGPQFLEIKRSFLNNVRKARTRVWMCTAYFVPTRKLRRALRQAALRGIDVRLLVPGNITDNAMAYYIGQRYYYRLLRDGVKIHEYQLRFMHAKLVMCDDWVSLGSCNVDRWNLQWNLDANQEIIDDVFSQSVTNAFNHDIKQSKQITLQSWKTRSRYRRIIIWFWSTYARFGESILRRMRIIRHWKSLTKKG